MAQIAGKLISLDKWGRKLETEELGIGMGMQTLFGGH